MATVENLWNRTFIFHLVSLSNILQRDNFVRVQHYVQAMCKPNYKCFHKIAYKPIKSAIKVL